MAQLTGWTLSKFDSGVTDDNIGPQRRPLVASMSLSWHGTMMPEDPAGYALVWVECDAEHYVFINSDEPDMLWVGNEWDEPIPELLATYAAHLDTNKTYANVGQVLSKLGQWSTRFLE
jgi:hypothetical protein